MGVGYKPIDIIAPHPKGIRPALVPYHPDVWARIRRSNRIDVYEVWDSQSDSDSVEDLVLSALTPNVETLSIVCFEPDTASYARDLVSTILGSMYDSKGNRFLDPSEVAPYIVLVPSALSDSKLEGFLATKLNLQTEKDAEHLPYMKGKSCGRGNHHYVRRGNYMKCTVCGSSKTIRGSR